MSDTYAIDGPDGYSLHGTMLECKVCKRKVLLELFVNGTKHHLSETVICAECLHINEEFRDEHPEIVEQIEEWMKR